MSSRSTFVTLVSVLLLASRALAADAFVITAAMSSADIQLVIDGAADGDILLFDPGSHGDSAADVLVVDGKGLALVGRGATRPGIAGVVVRNLPAGSNAVLQGLEFAPGGAPPFGPPGFTAIEIRDCDGGVLIEDCLVPDTGSKGGAALLVDTAAMVSVSRAELHGLDGESTLFCIPDVGSPALHTVASQVSVHATTLVGGAGGSSNDLLCAAGGGGDAVRVGPDFGAAPATHVVLSGNTLTGGPGGFQLGGGQASSGHALRVLDKDSSAWLVDNVLAGSVSAPPGAVLDYLGETARGLWVSAPVVENQAASLTMTGKQGDLIGIFWSFDTGWLPQPLRAGAFVMGTPLAGPIILGPHPGPDGDWTVPITGPALPPGIGGQYAFMQAFMKDPDTLALRISSATVYTLVDDGL